MDKNEAFPDMETGYTMYRALFFDALARLTRQGFAVQFTDAEDLIQDFFAYAWEGLAERYDSAYGPPASYAYGAFVRFARQRILRSQKWRSRLNDLVGLADHVAIEAAVPALDVLIQEEEAEVCRQTLLEIPHQQRTVLLDYFASGPRSRRQLARKYKVTRYRLDEILINTFGQLVARLAARSAWPLPDREVAFVLWCEGKGVREAAEQLGRPVEEVLATRERLVRLLAGLLKNGKGGGPPPSSPATEH